MTSEYANVPRQGDRMRAHSVFFQRNNASAAGYAVVSGMDPVRSSATAVLVAAGYYRSPSGAAVPFTQASITGIPVAASGKHRYDLIVFDCTDSTLKRVAGTEAIPTLSTDFLENLAPLPPELPNLKCILIAIICVDENGVQNANHGRYCTAGVADFRRVVPVLDAAGTKFAASARVLGRKTAGAGAGEECTVAEILAWITRPFEAAFPFGDGSAVLTPGSCILKMPQVACKIVAARIRSVDANGAPLSGSVTCTLYKHSLSGALGSAVDSFALSSATNYEETGLNVAVNAGEWLTVVTSGIASAKQIICSLSLEVT